MKYNTASVMIALAASSTLVLAVDYNDPNLYKDVNWSTVNYSQGFGNGAPAPAATTPPSNAQAAPAAPSSSSVVAENRLANNPAASPKSSSAAVAPAAAKSSSSPAAPAQSSKAPTSGGNTDSTTCNGPGMNIAWSGDSVEMKADSGASGTTTGCTNLGANFNGQVHVGGQGGTIFEGNYNGGNQFFDVSIIPGFSVPMVCSSKAGLTGCNIDLFSKGNKCPQQVGKICQNPVGENGKKTPESYAGSATAYPWCLACSPPDPFFQPCAGSAYAYPYDDKATITAAQGETIHCCIGTGCQTTGREGSTAKGNPQLNRDPPCGLCAGGQTSAGKRDLEEVFDTFEKEARDLGPHAHAKRHGKHRHQHGGLH